MNKKMLAVALPLSFIAIFLLNEYICTFFTVSAYTEVDEEGLMQACGMTEDEYFDELDRTGNYSFCPEGSDYIFPLMIAGSTPLAFIMTVIVFFLGYVIYRIRKK